jgi:DNA invertase Pin-like site-specific DNA recombinase
MLIGYARVSNQDQDTESQIAALETSGCELIFQEKLGRSMGQAGAARFVRAIAKKRCVGGLET